MGQHVATDGDIERMGADLIERIGQLEVRMVERIAAAEVGLTGRIAEMELRLTPRIAEGEVRVEQVGKRTLRWLAGLFIAQTFVLVGAVLGMIEVLR